MNQHYLNRYNKFINALKNQSIDGYYEKHHIVPKSMGGLDTADNLIKLTARQHYLAHWMLWKAYGGSMARAFFMMSCVKKEQCRSSKIYDKARQEYSEEVRKQMTGKPAQSKFTPEHREKLRKAKLGKKLTPEHRANVGKARIGKPLSEEHKMKISTTKRSKQGVTHV